MSTKRCLGQQQLTTYFRVPLNQDRATQVGRTTRRGRRAISREQQDKLSASYVRNSWEHDGCPRKRAGLTGFIVYTGRVGGIDGGPVCGPCTRPCRTSLSSTTIPTANNATPYWGQPTDYGGGREDTEDTYLFKKSDHENLSLLARQFSIFV